MRACLFDPSEWTQKRIPFKTIQAVFPDQNAQHLTKRATPFAASIAPKAPPDPESVLLQLVARMAV